MMKQTLLAAVFVGVFSVSASAQTVAAASSATASVGALSTNDALLPQPALSEQLSLVSAAFETPRPLVRPGGFHSAQPTRDAPPLKAEVLAKEAWAADDGLRVRGAKVAYKSRF